MKFRITIEVEYDPDTIGEPDAHTRDLDKEVYRAIGEGLLAPSHSGWVVTTYSAGVEAEGDGEGDA